MDGRPSASQGLLDEAAKQSRLLARFGVSLEAETLWRALLATPDAAVALITELTWLSSRQVETAVDELIAARLVQHGATPVGVVAIDPALAIESHIGGIERQLLDGLQQLATLRAEISTLASDYATARPAASSAMSIEVVVDVDDVRRQIYLAAESVKEDSRALYHFASVEGERDAKPSDIAMLQRGVRCRSIVGETLISDPEMYAELEADHERGVLFRTLTETPTHLLIEDRRLAVVAVDPTDLRRGAMFVRAPGLINPLILLFDHLWSIADPLFNSPAEPTAPAGRHARVLELMAIGTKDERIARSLGVGVRTIRRDIAELKTDLGVSTRAEVVATAIRKGWL